MNSQHPMKSMLKKKMCMCIVNILLYKVIIIFILVSQMSFSGNRVRKSGKIGLEFLLFELNIQSTH